MPNTKFPLLQIPNSWRECVVKFRIHHLRNKFGKLPQLFNHHQNITLEFLNFHTTSSPLPCQSIKAQDHQGCYGYFLQHVFNSYLLLLSWVWGQSGKKVGLLMWRNLINFKVLLQTILIWHCRKAWCAKCVAPCWPVIWHDVILFCFPSQIMWKFFLSFLFNITAPQNWIKKYRFVR